MGTRPANTQTGVHGMSAQIQPIFVLGLQRSGTTWVANTLAAHPQIAAVEADRHQGVHESVFFSHFARMYGDWSDPTCKSHAIEAFLQSDYCGLCGLSVTYVRDLAKRAQNAAAFFVSLMDQVAQSQEKQAWVEKSPHHTLLADDLETSIPEAKFLCITRSSRTLVRSRLWSYGRSPPPYPARALCILRACASNAFHSGALQQFSKRIGPHRAQLVTFDELQNHGVSLLDPFLKHCGLTAMDGVTSSYERNSSFGSERSRKEALNHFDLLLIAMCEMAVRLTPLLLLKKLHQYFATRRPDRFPDWVWAADAARSGISTLPVEKQ